MEDYMALAAQEYMKHTFTEIAKAERGHEQDDA